VIVIFLTLAFLVSFHALVIIDWYISIYICAYVWPYVGVCECVWVFVFAMINSVLLLCIAHVDRTSRKNGGALLTAPRKPCTSIGLVNCNNPSRLSRQTLSVPSLLRSSKRPRQLSLTSMSFMSFVTNGLQLSLIEFLSLTLVPPIALNHFSVAWNLTLLDLSRSLNFSCKSQVIKPNMTLGCLPLDLCPLVPLLPSIEFTSKRCLPMPKLLKRRYVK
jgi:hypothetical protein